MNNDNVTAMKLELERLNSIPEIQNIITSTATAVATAVTMTTNTITKAVAVATYSNMSDFNSATLQREYQKIVSAREKNYPTYCSEYRVIKTLIRQRNELIYQISKIYPDEIVQRLNTELIKISKLLTATLKSISEIFEQEKLISDVARRFEVFISKTP